MISNTIDFLQTRVCCMFVGNRDRKIEGNLIEFLGKRGWLLARERPCQFYPTAGAPTLAGKPTMTRVSSGAMIIEIWISYSQKQRSIKQIKLSETYPIFYFRALYQNTGPRTVAPDGCELVPST